MRLPLVFSRVDTRLTLVFGTIIEPRPSFEEKMPAVALVNGAEAREILDAKDAAASEPLRQWKVDLIVRVRSTEIDARNLGYEIHC